MCSSKAQSYCPGIEIADLEGILPRPSLPMCFNLLSFKSYVRKGEIMIGFRCKNSEMLNNKVVTS